MSALAAEIVATAARRGVTIAIAESLTGGAVLAALVDVPGASAVLRGGVVAYATELKHTLLDVPAGLLAARGAVDPDVAEAMALGVLRRTGADLAVATTGVAGPDPQDGQSVGLVYIGIASTVGGPRSLSDPRSLSERSETKGRLPVLDSAMHRFEGDRAGIRAAAGRAALEALRDALAAA